MPEGEIFSTGEGSAAPGVSPAIASYVSLFLLLLVFFTVLFSIASVQQSRSDALLHSLDEAFGGLPSRIGLIPKAATNGAFSHEEVRLGQEIGTLFQPFAAGQPAGKSSSGLLVLELGLDKLFAEDDLKLRDDAGTALDRLAILLQRKIGDTRFRVVWHTAPGSEKQVAALAQRLFAQGTPADSIALQLDDLPAGRIGAWIVPVPAWHGGSQD